MMLPSAAGTVALGVETVIASGVLRMGTLKSACDDLDYDAVRSLLDIGVDPNSLLPSNIRYPIEDAVSQGEQAQYNLFSINS